VDDPGKLESRVIDAVIHRDLAALDRALADGADPDTLGGPVGERLLSLAMSEAFPEGVTLLLANGADPAYWYLPSGGAAWTCPFLDAEEWSGDPNQPDPRFHEAARIILSTGKRPTDPAPERDPCPPPKRWWQR
jgi:hypothetical protein